MGALAVDYSSARPDPHALAAAGYRHVLRYLSHEPSKNLTPAERDALHAAEIFVGLVWETTANRTLGGEAAGRQDAVEANAQADALGFPKDRVIFYAVDFDASAGQISGPITSYFNGANSVGGRPRGVYGSYRVIEGIVGAGIVGCGWQCAAWSGTGTGTGGSIDGRRLSAHACLFQHPYQVLGGACDVNDVLMDPTPWAWHPNKTAAPQPPKHEDDEMLTIYWSKPDSAWVRDVAKLDGTISQGFAVEGRFAKWIGERARPGHEGWDPRTQAVRTILALQGFPDGQREADAGDDLLGTLCLLPDALATTPVDPAGIVADLRQPLTDAVTAALQGLHVDVDEAAVASAVLTGLHDRLAS